MREPARVVAMDLGPVRAALAPVRLAPGEQEPARGELARIAREATPVRRHGGVPAAPLRPKQRRPARRARSLEAPPATTRRNAASGVTWCISFRQSSTHNRQICIPCATSVHDRRVPGTRGLAEAPGARQRQWPVSLADEPVLDRGRFETAARRQFGLRRQGRFARRRICATIGAVHPGGACARAGPWQRRNS